MAFAHAFSEEVRDSVLLSFNLRNSCHFYPQSTCAPPVYSWEAFSWVSIFTASQACVTIRGCKRSGKYKKAVDGVSIRAGLGAGGQLVSGWTVEHRDARPLHQILCRSGTPPEWSLCTGLRATRVPGTVGDHITLQKLAEPMCAGLCVLFALAPVGTRHGHKEKEIISKGWACGSGTDLRAMMTWWRGVHLYPFYLVFGLELLKHPK